MPTLLIPQMPQTLESAQAEIRVCRELLASFVSNLKDHGEWPGDWSPWFVEKVQSRLPGETP